ncbi:MAG: hypothetical protein HYX37_14705 [Rhizobiales bacterium]|nr:hypothetical protein [Hyphomicrobiales bacterium]
MIARVITIIAAATFMAASAEAAEFTYSATNGPACANIKSKREFNSWRCPGPAGYSARFFDFGNMVAVEFGLIGKEKAIVEDDLMWQGADKSFGDKIEWRMTAGRPYGAILRIQRQDFDEKAGETRTVEELLVIKVSPQGACRMGVVDGKWRDANAVAREMADSTAAVFRCGADQPRTIGASSPS